MAHGITLKMRAIKRPETRYLFINPPLVKLSDGRRFGQQRHDGPPYRNPAKDRSLPGKARLRARRAARR